MKNKRIIIVVIIILVVAVVLLLGTKKVSIGGTSKLKENVVKTEISEETTGYRLDLRIYGTYNKKSINKIIMVNNYKNTDKEIRITDLSSGRDSEKIFLVKDKKYYEVVDKELKEVGNILYEDTDIYLEGVKNIKELKEKGKEKLGENEYTVYTGKVSKSIMNKMLDKTDTKIKVEKDADTEVWITSDNHVYKVYYKVDELTLYPSYFGYNKSNTIDLNNYKTEVRN